MTTRLIMLVAERGPYLLSIITPAEYYALRAAVARLTILFIFGH
jgi:hypothetical protein